MKAYSEVEVMALREKYGVIMKRLPQNADLTGLTLVEKSTIKKCMSKFCLHDLESCPCNSHKDSSKYCENYAHMVKIYAKISQPDLFTPVEHVA